MGGGNISASTDQIKKPNNITTFDDPPLEKTLLVDHHQTSSQPSMTTPSVLSSSYNDMTHIMRPLFDIVHTLRCMNVTEQSITLPTIVVIGDQSSGKSSLIKSLTGIDLPSGNGICTRVPLIMRIQHHSDPVSELRLEYDDKSVLVNETNVSTWISCLTEKLAGEDMEISELPLTLTVKMNNVLDVTIVDLPGIPVHGQLGKEKISDILETYTKLEDCVILNVISGNADFLTCESIKFSKKFDKNEERTLYVVTKADKASEDMITIVTTNYTGPDFVCVRNRLGDETHEQARDKESALFESHNLLSKIDKSMVGVHIVAQKLFQLQLEGISKCLCGIVAAINEDLNTCVVEQNRLLQQHNFTTVSEAMPAFMQIIEMSKQSIVRVIVFNEFEEFRDETQMHCSIGYLDDMSKEFSRQLRNIQVKKEEKFLADEILALKDGKSSPEQVFHILFQGKIEMISEITNAFVTRVWDYIELVIIKALRLHAQNLYPQLFSSLKKAAKNVTARQKESFKCKLLQFLDMKKLKGYTCDPEVKKSWNKLKKSERKILDTLKCNRGVKSFMKICVSIWHLHEYPETVLNKAFDIKTRMVACLEMGLKHFFDSVDLDIRSMVEGMMANEMESQMVNELKSDGENRYNPLLKESHSMTTRRWKLKNRIELLQKSKRVVENAMDEISFLNF